MTIMGLEYLKYKETERSNLTRESETNRSNLANEDLKKEINIETNRSNLANESLKRDSNIETRRSNMSNEDIRRNANVETNRSNLAREAETNRNNTLSAYNQKIRNETEIAKNGNVSNPSALSYSIAYNLEQLNNISQNGGRHPMSIVPNSNTGLKPINNSQSSTKSKPESQDDRLERINRIGF